jgi:hypothetical protein
MHLKSKSSTQLSLKRDKNRQVVALCYKLFAVWVTDLKTTELMRKTIRATVSCNEFSNLSIQFQLAIIK